MRRTGKPWQAAFGYFRNESQGKDRGTCVVGMGQRGKDALIL